VRRRQPPKPCRAVARQDLESDAAHEAFLFPLRPSGGRGRGPSHSDGRVRWASVGALESPTSPRPSPPPGAERGDAAARAGTHP
jgi:hypothetical protein